MFFPSSKPSFSSSLGRLEIDILVSQVRTSSYSAKSGGFQRIYSTEHLVLLASCCPSSLLKDVIIPQYLLGLAVVDQYVFIPVITVCGWIIQVVKSDSSA